MRKVFRINFRFMISAFVCFAAAFTFVNFSNVFAITAPDPNRLGFYDEASWCPRLIDPPYSMPSVIADSLSVFCGTVVGSDGNGPIEGLTVAQYEADPEMPTGKYKGRLTGLYNSTGTDENGKFHLITRKVGPGGNTVYFVFFCNQVQLEAVRAGSLFDNYQLDTMAYRNEHTACTVLEPDMVPIEVDLSNRNILLGADVGDAGFENDVPIGSEIVQDMAFNTNTGEQYHDLRFTKMNVDLDALWGVSNYSQTGGEDVMDCLTEYHDPYYCNYQEYMKTSDQEDYLTRIAFGFIPNQCTFPTERRFELRGGVQRTNRDPFIAMQSNSILFGDYNDASKDLMVRIFGNPKVGEEALIDCECLKAGNSEYLDPGIDTLCPDRGVLLNSGWSSRLSSGVDWYQRYRSGAFEVDRNTNVCKLRGRDVTVGELAACAFDNECSNGITKDYWRPEVFISNGESYEGVTSRWHTASKYLPTVKSELEHQRVNTALTRLPYTVGSATPIPTGDINGEVSGANSLVRALRVTSFDIVPNNIEIDPYMDDHPDSHSFISPAAEAKDYHADASEMASVTAVYNLGRPIQHASIGLEYKQLGYEQEGAMKLDNYFEERADYADNNDADSYGHSRNKASSTGIYYTNDSIIRDDTFEGGQNVRLAGGADHAIEGFVADVLGADYRWGRSFIDSLYTIMSGTGEGSLPARPNGDGFDLSVPYTALGTAWDAIFNNDGPEKSMGQRANNVGVGTTPRDQLLPVDFPLCEDNFNTIFYPPRSPYNAVIDPGSWGSDACYPWHPLPINDSCGTFTGSVTFYHPGLGTTITVTDPELSGGVSRTCRVEDCRQLQVTETCDCDAAGNEINCGKRYDFEDTQCGADFNYQCASHGAQRSCYNLGTTDYDRNCVLDSFPDDEVNARCGPLDIDCVDCARDTQDLPVCSMGVAGPYICAGELEVGNTDVRVRQELPLNTSGTDTPPVQKNTNPIVDSLKITESTFKSPAELEIMNSSAVNVD